MQQQQHIQAIMKIDEEKLQVTPLTIEFCFVFEFVCFIFFLFLIYFSLFFIRVGIGTGFPISFYRNF
jgi:hypothetical protein